MNKKGSINGRLIPTFPCPVICSSDTTQPERDVGSMLEKCWAGVADDGSTLNQHWINVPYLLGVQTQ